MFIIIGKRVEEKSRVYTDTREGDRRLQVSRHGTFEDHLRAAVMSSTAGYRYHPNEEAQAARQGKRGGTAGKMLTRPLQ